MRRRWPPDDVREAAQSIGVELDIGKYAPAKEKAHDGISMWAVDLPRFPTAMTGAPKQYVASSASTMMRIYENLHPESRVMYEIVGDGPVWAFFDLEAAVENDIVPLASDEQMALIRDSKVEIPEASECFPFADATIRHDGSNRLTSAHQTFLCSSPRH